MANNSLDDYTAEFITETELAVLVDFGYGEEVWVAKEHIVYIIDDATDTIKITMPEWLAIQKGAV